MPDNKTRKGSPAAAPVAEKPAKISRRQDLPEFVDLPSGTGREFYSGLKRGKLNHLLLPCAANGFRPPVRSISLRPPGAAKGKRLIVLASLLGYLRSLEDHPGPSVPTKNPQPA